MATISSTDMTSPYLNFYQLRYLKLVVKRQNKTSM